MADEAEGSRFNIHPMEQFQIHPLFGDGPVHWYTITNATLWMALVIAGISLLLIAGSRGRALVPSRGQSMAESVYGFTYKMIEDVAGKEGAKFFPYIMTLFMFILFCNVFALIPTSLAVTSHVAVTGVLALAVFFTVTAVGFAKHGVGFLKLFWVSSAPTVALRIILAMIEVISYFVRPLSHSVRLAGNMMAGHSVIKVFAGFAGALGVGAVLPIVAISAVFGLELMVAFIQAYVFAILTCVYLNDALHPGH